MTAGAVDLGEKPSVVSAIVKYHLTEHMRKVVNDAMDVRGGSGICLGPHNLIGRAYQALPISITVEGANILTRSLIIYGQGAVRCHPYVFQEMQAVAEKDPGLATRGFDNAFFPSIAWLDRSLVVVRDGIVCVRSLRRTTAERGVNESGLRTPAVCKLYFCPGCRLIRHRIASGSFFITHSAASPTHGAVSRLQGSPMIDCGEI